MPLRFQNHPVVIDPYDAIVQSAVLEMGPELKNVDVIKLEATCPGDRVAWVSNKDFFEGDPRKKRVIHLCLKKIQDQFRKIHGEPFTITDPSEKQKMKEVIKQYLKDVILPHETEHIHQEMRGEGRFGPSPETQAEKAEQWKNLEQMGIKKRFSMTSITSSLDILADHLESAGLLKEAEILDVISNTLEKGDA